jgi:hypothetical protein
MISARNAFLAIYTRMVASLVVAVNVGMRQTALALALTLGVSPKVVSEQLRHTSGSFHFKRIFTRTSAYAGRRGREGGSSVHGSLSSSIPKADSDPFLFSVASHWRFGNRASARLIKTETASENAEAKSESVRRVALFVPLSNCRI